MAEKQVRPAAEFKPPKWVASAPPASAALEAIQQEGRPGGAAGRTLALGAKGSYVIGRVETADIILEHSSISRHHCAVAHHSDGRVYIIE